MKPDWERDGIKLYLADCRDVLPTLADCSIDMVFCDPPYGHNNNNGDLIQRWEVALGKQANVKEARPIVNDGAEANELFQEVLPIFNRLLQPGCCCCCGGGGGPDPQFARWSLWMDEAIGFKQMVVWDKGPMGMGWHYRRSYETVLVAEKPGAACRWCDETNAIENIIRPGQNGIRKIIPTADDHPTPKPIGLCAHFLRLHSRLGDVVLDPFMGQGPTGVAAVRMERNFIGIEIDRDHFDIAVKRIEAEFNRHPLLESAPERQLKLLP